MGNAAAQDHLAPADALGVTVEAGEAEVPPPADPPEPRLRPDRTLQAMIGQMILIGFPGSDPAEEWPRRAASLIRDGRVGGVVLFSDNVKNPAQLRELVDELAGAGEGPTAPFICVDQEGGTIRRLTTAKGFVDLPSAATVGKLGEAEAYRLYHQTATELASLGFNMSFGPVVDLNINPRNPAIGRLGRSYSRNPDRVVGYAREFIDAHEDMGVLAVAKHFPGHGSAANDPHDEIVDITQTWQAVELEPFQALIADDAIDAVMVGHLIHPRFSDRGDLPASLSQRAIEGVLRGELGFAGLVITDDLDMGAIRTRYGIEQAAVMAVAAGADLLIIANHKQPDPLIADRIASAVSQAIAEGRIPAERVRKAYSRITETKARLALRKQLTGGQTDGLADDFILPEASGR